MRAAGVILACLGALALQTTIGRFIHVGGFGVDLLLVVVVYTGLTAGSATGLLTGAIAGPAQDALSSGVLGMSGLAKTVIGYLSGIIGTQFIVSQPLPRFMVFLAATILHQTVFIGLSVLLGLRQLGNPYPGVAAQALINAGIGIIAFQAVELLPGAIERRRLTRTNVRR